MHPGTHDELVEVPVIGSTKASERFGPTPGAE